MEKKLGDALAPSTMRNHMVGLRMFSSDEWGYNLYSLNEKYSVF